MARETLSIIISPGPAWRPEGLKFFQKVPKARKTLSISNKSGAGLAARGLKVLPKGPEGPKNFKHK